MCSFLTARQIPDGRGNLGGKNSSLILLSWGRACRITLFSSISKIKRQSR
jgi:hypothetical protein